MCRKVSGEHLTVCPSLPPWLSIGQLTLEVCFTHWSRWWGLITPRKHRGLYHKILPGGSSSWLPETRGHPSPHTTVKVVPQKTPSNTRHVTTFVLSRRRQKEGTRISSSEENGWNFISQEQQQSQNSLHQITMRNDTQNVHIPWEQQQSHSEKNKDAVWEHKNAPCKSHTK